MLAWLFRLVLVLVALSTPALQSHASAQEATRVVPDEPTCARCRITMTDVVVLRDSSAAHMPGPPRDVAVDARGRYWLVYNNALPLVYRPDGGLLRELGPQGEGPGELQGGQSALPLPGDSMLVWDGRRRAFHVLTGELRIARTIPTPGRIAYHAVLAWPDRIFNQRGSTFPTGSGEAIPGEFDLISLSGPVALTSFTFGAGHSGGVARAGANAAWAWGYSPYYVELWDGARLTRALERRPSWFPWTDTPMPPRQPDQLPPPHLQGARQDAAGRLWVFANVPVEVWAAGSLRGPTSQMERYYRTRVEVLDPVAGRVVASTQLDAWIVAVLPGERAAVYGTTPQGTPFVKIVQLRLVQ